MTSSKGETFEKTKAFNKLVASTEEEEEEEEEGLRGWGGREENEHI